MKKLEFGQFDRNGETVVKGQIRCNWVKSRSFSQK